MPDFPRTPPGRTWPVDDGARVAVQMCPNCGSDRYHVSVSIEECPSCGIRFDYWGGRGGNDAWKAFQARQERQQDHEAFEREMAFRREAYEGEGEDY